MRDILLEFDQHEAAHRAGHDVARLVVQAVSAVFLVFALAFHIAEVGIIGLTIIVLQTAFNGIVEEHRLGHAFEEALPLQPCWLCFLALSVLFMSSTSLHR